MSQLTCPGRGTLKALFWYMTTRSPRICAWLSNASVNKKILDYYSKELGLLFAPEVFTFMNTYKGDYSDYRYGTKETSCKELLL